MSKSASLKNLNRPFCVDVLDVPFSLPNVDSYLILANNKPAVVAPINVLRRGRRIYYFDISEEDALRVSNFRDSIFAPNGRFYSFACRDDYDKYSLRESEIISTLNTFYGPGFSSIPFRDITLIDFGQTKSF